MGQTNRPIYAHILRKLHRSRPSPIPYSEVRTAITEVKNKKAPGRDRIQNELLKVAADQLTPIISKIFKRILETEDIPEQWKSSTRRARETT